MTGTTALHTIPCFKEHKKKHKKSRCSKCLAQNSTCQIYGTSSNTKTQTHDGCNVRTAQILRASQHESTTGANNICQTHGVSVRQLGRDGDADKCKISPHSCSSVEPTTAASDKQVVTFLLSSASWPAASRGPAGTSKSSMTISAACSLFPSPLRSGMATSTRTGVDSFVSVPLSSASGRVSESALDSSRAALVRGDAALCRANASLLDMSTLFPSAPKPSIHLARRLDPMTLGVLLFPHMEKAPVPLMDRGSFEVSKQHATSPRFARAKNAASLPGKPWTKAG